jgi:hypothetical protein
MVPVIFLLGVLRRTLERAACWLNDPDRVSVFMVSSIPKASLVREAALHSEIEKYKLCKVTSPTGLHTNREWSHSAPAENSLGSTEVLYRRLYVATQTSAYHTY